MAKISSLLDKKAASRVAAIGKSSKQIQERVRIANLVVSRITAQTTKARTERMRRSVFLRREKARLEGTDGNDGTGGTGGAGEGDVGNGNGKGKKKGKGRSKKGTGTQGGDEGKTTDDNDPMVDVTYPAKPVYCICARCEADTRGSFMMQCSNEHCGGWFHPPCLGMADEVAKQSIENFICVFCEAAYPQGTIARTSFAADADIGALTEIVAMRSDPAGGASGKTSPSSSLAAADNGDDKEGKKKEKEKRKRKSRKRKRKSAGDAVAKALISNPKLYEKAKKKAEKMVESFRRKIKKEEEKAREAKKGDDKRKKEESKKRKREEDHKALQLLSKSRQRPSRLRKLDMTCER